MGYDPTRERRLFDALFESLCSAGHVGEMFSSAAPYDPAFWPIHPTTERLLHYRRDLARSSGAAAATTTAAAAASCATARVCSAAAISWKRRVGRSSYLLRRSDSFCERPQGGDDECPAANPSRRRFVFRGKRG
jgi:hypothetical protein